MIRTDKSLTRQELEMKLNQTISKDTTRVITMYDAWVRELPERFTLFVMGSWHDES